MIWGAKELEDRRILSWSMDDSGRGAGTLRLWDAETGHCTATLEGHAGLFWGAMELEDGQILSWSGSQQVGGDGTLRLWDAEPQGTWAIDKAAFEVPRLWLTYKHQHSLGTLTEEAGAAQLEQGISCVFPELKFRVLWQGEGQWKVHLLLPEGKIVVTNNSHLNFCGLHYGNRHVTLAEAETALKGEATAQL